MLIIKITILLLIFITSSLLGFAFASKYRYRVNELKDTKSALNMLKTKISYTYEPLPSVFSQISEKFKESRIR